MSRVRSIITLTERAVQQLSKISKDDHVLKFSIEGGGCVGMKQKLDYVPKDKLDKYDEIIKAKDTDNKNVEVAIDKDSVMKLMGTTIDYEEKLISSGFTIDNPNVELACGCGESVIFKD
jgi:iron-sulfur cluster assembly protein